MGKRGVKEEIINFNPRTINPENREGVEKLLKKNADSFDEQVAIIFDNKIWEQIEILLSPKIFFKYFYRKLLPIRPGSELLATLIQSSI